MRSALAIPELYCTTELGTDYFILLFFVHHRETMDCGINPNEMKQL